MTPNILDLVARVYAIAEVGGVGGIGPERGRNFEQLFYKICDRFGVRLTERAGGRSVAGQRSASGFRHEVDGASRAASATTYWELKHLSSALEKNELLIFNGKALDYLYEGSSLFTNAPLLRFLLSGRNIRDDCRTYGVQWGITIIEPGRFAVPLIYEAMLRGFAPSLSSADREAVRVLGPWACRSLQEVINDVARRCAGNVAPPLAVSRRAREVLDMQEQIGPEVLDALEDRFPDWVNEVAQDVWDTVGGW